MMEYWGWDYMFERWKDLWLNSLYVGNLERNTREEDLYDLFSETAHVVRVHICRDPSAYVSFGYGYVFFANHYDGNQNLLTFICFQFCKTSFTSIT